MVDTKETLRQAYWYMRKDYNELQKLYQEQCNTNKQLLEVINQQNNEILELLKRRDKGYLDRVG